MFCRIRLTSFCYFTKLSGGLWSENLWINICYDVQTTGSVPTARLYRRGGQVYILSKPYKAARGVSYGTIPVIQPRMEGVTMGGGEKERSDHFGSLPPSFGKYEAKFLPAIRLGVNNSACSKFQAPFVASPTFPLCIHAATLQQIINNY